MAGELLTPDALRATWSRLAEPTRTTITAALIAAVDAELHRIDTFYPASYGDVPTVEVLGVLADSAGARHLHFLAHHLNYNHAQSGSDWADHYVIVGSAVLSEEAALGAISLTMAVHNGIREHDWDTYRTDSVDNTVAEVRAKTIAPWCGPPPVEHLVIVRCPRCGATDAGASDYMIELTRMTCEVCGHEDLYDSEQIKDEWNVPYERPLGEQTLAAFVAPLPSSEPGFELRGGVADETRMLADPGIGYAIAIPGGPRQIAPPRGTPAHCVILRIEPGIEVVVRASREWSMTTQDDLLRRTLQTIAQRRARPGSVLELASARMRPPGSTASMSVTYPRRGDAGDAMELLALTLEGEHPSYQSIYLIIRYHTSRLDPFAWANLRAALLAHQTWVRGELPALPVWPAASAFADPTLRLAVTRRALEAARANAAALGALTAAQAQRLVEVLVTAASTDDRPTTPWPPPVAPLTLETLAACVGADLAEVLVSDLAAMQSMHDFRAWCKGSIWAVENRRVS